MEKFGVHDLLALAGLAKARLLERVRESGGNRLVILVDEPQFDILIVGVATVAVGQVGRPIFVTPTHTK